MSTSYSPPPLPFRLIRRLFLILFSLYPKKIEGMNNLPKHGPAIFACNHSSLLDGFLLVVYLSRAGNTYIHFMTKDKYFDNPLANFLLKTSEAIKVTLSDPKASFFGALKLLEKGQLVGIFPEGTRSHDGRIQRGKSGTASLALRSKAPLIPVGVVGTKDIL